ncbi:hypothetical protein vBAbaPP1_166 [Acinetobacter phage vB_AbaM_P1]|nr:hypothetical protein vBAbaPP1_166 [Acinetobacter phage vB_AbaM_P1]
MSLNRNTPEWLKCLITIFLLVIGISLVIYTYWPKHVC